MIKSIFIFGIISIINCSDFDSDNYLHYLLENNKYDNAIYEIDRLIYINQNNEYKNNYYKMMEGYIYQLQSKHNMAIKIYNELLQNDIDLENKIIDTLKYNYALSLFEIGKFEKSLNLLDSLDLDIAKNLLFVNLLLLSEKNIFINYNLEQSEINNIKHLQSKLKNPKLASFLSSIVPGLGQVYSKHYFDGLQSFIINLISFSFTSLSFNSNNNILSFITLSSTGILYYSNIISANKTVYYYNQRTKQQYIINKGLFSNPVLITNYEAN